MRGSNMKWGQYQGSGKNKNKKKRKITMTKWGPETTIDKWNVFKETQAF